MQKKIPDYFVENQNIKEKTYYKMGGIARYFSTPSNLFEIQQTILWCHSQQLPCSILGSGSNSVYSDENFSGVILSLENLNHWFWETDEYLFVEAGVTNTEIAEICMVANRAGASWMFRMPGQVGASVRMNARCYGGEISQIVKNVLTIDHYGYIKTYTSEEIFQGYKLTTLMHKPEIVVGVRLFFPNKLAAEKLLKHMLICEEDRHKKKHFFLPSCGSTFKNNYSVGKPSGQIFDELGLKGLKVGAAEVSQFHANFVWNMGSAKTKDMLNLTAIMRSKAKKELNAELELEVQPVGLFPKEMYQKCGMENLGPSYENEHGKKWVGLFYYPNSFVTKLFYSNNEFPKILYEGPFFEYFQTPFNGRPDVFVSLCQLISLEDAKKNPAKPFLQWKTFTTDNPNKIFSIPVAEKYGKKNQKFIDELWNFSVSEIFFAHPDKPKTCYLEFEVTPNGEWIAFEFDGVRQRSTQNLQPNLKLWDSLTINNMSIHFHNDKDLRYVFGMNFTFNNLKNVISEQQNFISFQCALSLGYGKYYLSPAWKHVEYSQLKNKKRKKDEILKADFHQPSNFWKLKLF
ncbi:UDP-N-acetylmuramate dehydrogenase [Pigmentibacter sp. JX0631]|uniref:UDP-N-acetylmuramate dehydrogenase n=1 Tax=Pigmentibacter sp. JX0631 TaxID=2976982 RepID=UPI0024686389|nr:UDP-N-acetylmuramate dehydrogenase [Pigmentibacter sp. JX0631]WGL59153.1 UDP-N-acetylmuramate dehydrogenase [Pigmentibacter sp. JX0631]